MKSPVFSVFLLRGGGGNFYPPLTKIGLRKGVYPYEYMDSWERFDETLLSHKEAFVVA